MALLKYDSSEEQYYISVRSLPEDGEPICLASQMQSPRPCGPIVGVLMKPDPYNSPRKGKRGRYVIDCTDIETLRKSGADLRFLTYDNPVKQFIDNKCQGLYLPESDVEIPEWYYDGPKDPITILDVSPHCRAHVDLIEHAKENGIKILAFGTAAQIVGGVFGLKINRKLIKTFCHNDHCSHEIVVPPPLNYELFGVSDRTRFVVESNHKTNILLRSFQNSDLAPWGMAEDALVPEIWGNEEKGILCLQFCMPRWSGENKKLMGYLFGWFINQITLTSH